MIREMKLEDYEEVKNLINQVHEIHVKYREDLFETENRLDYEEFRTSLSRPNALNYVYHMNHQVKGILIASASEAPTSSILKPRSIYFIHDLVVDQGCIHLGIGKQLMQHFETLARFNNVDAIELNVYAFNKQAIHFYEAFGLENKMMRMEKKIV